MYKSIFADTFTDPVRLHTSCLLPSLRQGKAAVSSPAWSMPAADSQLQTLCADCEEAWQCFSPS